MSYLKVKLGVEDNAVYMEVLEQIESLRGKGLIFTSSDGLDLFSADSPELRGCQVFIRGNDREWDNHVTLIRMKDNSDAINYCNQIELLVSEFNGTMRNKEIWDNVNNIKIVE